MTSDRIKDHESACAYIRQAEKLGSRPGLDSIRSLCTLLGNPQDKLKVIHVAGTNGKGSTAALIASALSEAGLTTGMYYSPALSQMTDHYRINGKAISDDDYDDAVRIVAASNDELKKNGDGATVFELETAMAFVYFLRKKCDVVILECGMGGKSDATNVASQKLCCVITSISFDHMQYLGSTLYDIASAKAGIITGSFPVIAYDPGKEALRAIKERCDLMKSPLYVVKKDDIVRNGKKICYGGLDDVELSLNGSFQADNAAVAIKTLSVIRDNGLIPGSSIGDDVIRKGIKNVKWPYRFMTVCEDPLVIVDGAHNADAAVRLKETIEEELSGRVLILVMAMFSDKEYEKAVSTLAELARYVFTAQTPENPRALPAKKLADAVKPYCRNVSACESISRAYELAADTAKKIGKDAAVVACGSLSYLAEFAKCAGYSEK